MLLRRRPSHGEDGVDMPTYRESIIRQLTSYPPGSSERLERLEELRLRTVGEFARLLSDADDVVRWGNELDLLGGCYDDEEEGGVVKSQLGVGGRSKGESAESVESQSPPREFGTSSEEEEVDGDDESDADDSIEDEMREFLQREHDSHRRQQRKSSHDASHHNPLGESLMKKWHMLTGHPDDGEGDSPQGTGGGEGEISSRKSSNNPLQRQTPEELRRGRSRTTM